MKITKYGHCCMLVEENGVRIMTDPGNLTTEQNEVKNVHIILITHEHADHIHIDSLKAVLANNPETKVITNTAVAPMLEKESIAFTLIADQEAQTIDTILIEAFEMPHALLHATLPQVLNTGFLIAERLFFPGDAYVLPGKPVEILALPVAGPWAKSAELTDYALAVKPKRCFPVHDGVLKVPALGSRVPSLVLPKEGIEYFIPENSVSFEL